ncbi:MAG: agmatine deiminase family protein [Methylacidiphilales bacterium]|nr:agmatine deiminase family protein [Candidatus Methylacidiphilales bacterium]
MIGNVAETGATPRALGFHMPAEWERHEATWLTWPRPEGISFPDAFEPIPALWAGLAKLLAEGEQVHINVFSPEHEVDIRSALKKAGAPVDKRIHLHLFPSYEPWCRDHGPIFVRKKDEMAIVDWRYNAWGGKYPPCDLDDDVPKHVAKLQGMRLFSPPMILEGGSIEVNGAGTLLTTEACLLNPNRNPNLTQGEIEQYLRDYLGVEQILWLGEGIAGDDTDGHIDDLTRFVNEDTFVTILEDDPSDENYQLLVENRKRLESLRDPQGRPWRIVELPTPGRIEKGGERLPASYANFYIANEVVVVPGFDHPNDAKARDILQKLFPTRRVVVWPALDLIWGLGAFHCITQQQPAL